MLYLESVGLGFFHDLQDEGGEHVEALAVSDRLVPPGVGEQDPLQHHLVLLGVLAAEEAAPRAVEVLKRRPRPV